MAKRGVLEHPKTLTLADTLGIMDCFALGIMEAFWHHVAKYHEDGDITDLKPGTLARSIRYTRDPEELVDAMISAGFIDRLNDGKLVVHGWSEHCDDSIHAKLFRAIKLFADKSRPKCRSVAADERQKCEQLWAEFEASQVQNSPPKKGRPSTVRKTSGVGSAGHPTDTLPSLSLSLAKPSHAKPSHSPCCVASSLPSWLKYLSHHDEASGKPYTKSGLKALESKLSHLEPGYANRLLEFVMEKKWKGIPGDYLPTVQGAAPEKYIPDAKGNQRQSEETPEPTYRSAKAVLWGMYSKGEKPPPSADDPYWAAVREGEAQAPPGWQQ